jgi:DNA-binding beta-propeller fold protein YncE
MNIKSNLRKITELGIGLTAVAILALAGCGGGGGDSAPASVVVSTLVDSSSRIFVPAGITSDGTYLYVTDTVNNNILKIDIATKAVTILAGDINGASGTANATTGTVARFNFPWGIALDSTNTKLYVADSYNHTIRQIDLSTASAAVTTFAGIMSTPGWADTATGTPTFAYPMGIGRIGNNLFVADGHNTIRKIDLTHATVSTLAGSAVAPGGNQDGTGASAVLYGPTGLATDGASFVYVTEDSNNNVRKIDATTGETMLIAGGNYSLPNSGVGSTDASGISARFNKPMGITTDGTNLYVTDTYNHTIRKIVIATGFVSTPAGAVLVPGNTDGSGPNARFRYPTGIVYVNGTLYVADYTNGSIRKIQP